MNVKLGGMSVRVPICNPMPEEAALKANQMLARRAAVVSSPATEHLPFSRDLIYDDIVRPEVLTTGEQEELLQVLKS